MKNGIPEVNLTKVPDGSGFVSVGFPKDLSLPIFKLALAML
jgi:hypothetical protein